MMKMSGIISVISLDLNPPEYLWRVLLKQCFSTHVGFSFHLSPICVGWNCTSCYATENKHIFLSIIYSLKHFQDDKSLGQNLHRQLGEELMYPPDVGEHESAGAGWHRNVGSEGQLAIQCHTQVPCSLRHHRVLKVVSGSCLPWKEEQVSLVQREIQVVCRHPLRDVSKTLRDLCFHLGFRLG